MKEALRMPMNTQESVLELGLAELDNISTQNAAEIVACMEKANLANYKNFLCSMYHYSLEGEAQLLRAAAAAPNKDLKEFNIELAMDESGHHELAEADLKSFGLGVHFRTPLEVELYHDYWKEFTPDKVFEYLAATVVVENTVAKLEKGAVALAKRLELSEEQSRWVKIHCELDQEHGELSINEAKKHLDANNFDLMVEGAKRDARLFTDMLLSAFTEKYDMCSVNFIEERL